MGDNQHFFCDKHKWQAVHKKANFARELTRQFFSFQESKPNLLEAVEQQKKSPDLASENTEGISSSAALLRGVLWQQREKRFSRWKERFFILTSDYLQCFRKGSSKISEMGAFIYRVRLCEVSYYTTLLRLHRGPTETLITLLRPYCDTTETLLRPY